LEGLVILDWSIRNRVDNRRTRCWKDKAADAIACDGFLNRMAGAELPHSRWHVPPNFGGAMPTEKPTLQHSIRAETPAALNLGSRIDTEFPAKDGWQVVVEKVTAFDPQLCELARVHPELLSKIDLRLSRYEARLMKNGAVIRSASFTGTLTQPDDEQSVYTGALLRLCELAGITFSPETVPLDARPVMVEAPIHGASTKSQATADLPDSPPKKRPSVVRPLPIKSASEPVPTPPGVDSRLMQQIVQRRKLLTELAVPIPADLATDPTTNEQARNTLAKLQSLK
jgi:hypothetical protein